LKKILLAFLVVLLGCGGGGGGGGGDDGGGGSGNTPPVAAFTGSPLSGPVPLTVQFASQSTGDVTSHQWDVNNDGTINGGTYTYNHIYTATGTYTVSLTVVGPAGTDSTTKTDYITVNVLPPNAAFTGTPTSGTPDLRVAFANTSVRYTQSTWNFGDGSTSTEDSPTHTYTAVGSYNVSLDVLGEGGTDLETKTGYINVSALGTPAIILDPKYTDTSNGSTITLSLKVMGVTGLAAAQVKLAYDTSKATIGNVAFGDFLKGNTDPLLIVTKDESNGEVIIYTSSLSSDKPSADGDGVIATVEFTVTSTTSIIFDNSNIIFLNVDGNNITVNGSQDGYIYVN
jgi:PKD repeat protein